MLWLVPQSRRAVPPEAVAPPIDRSGTLTRGLVALVVGSPAGAPRNLVPGRPEPVVAAGVARGAGISGREWRNPGGANGQTINLGALAGLGGTGPATVFVRGHLDGANAAGTFQSVLGQGASGVFLRFGAPSGGNSTPQFGTFNGTSFDTVSGGAVAVGAPVSLAGVHRGSTNEAWVNGKRSSAAASPRAQNANLIAMLFGEGNGVQSWNGGFSIAAMWARALTPAELLALHVNPWRLLAPAGRRWWARVAPAALALDDAPLTDLALSDAAVTDLTLSDAAA